MKNSYEKLALAASLIIIFSLGFFSILNKSMTWDEACYIGTGKYILKTGNLQYNALVTHPPLSFYINSIFLLPLKFVDRIYSNDNCWEIGVDMVYHSGYNPKLILILARFPFIIMSMLLALLVFSWAKQLYGVRSGLLALVLYTFSTSIISQSNLAMTDFPVAFFIFTTMYCHWKFISANQNKFLYSTSVFFGLALLTKLTGLILIPTLMILFFYQSLKNKINKKNTFVALKQLFTIFIIGILVMLIGFGFQFKPLKSVMPEHYIERAYQEFDKQIKNEKLHNLAIYTFEKIPIPFPSYFFGFAGVSFHSQQGQGSFLNGELYTKTIWYFPIAVFLYKTQVSLIVLFILSLIFFQKTKSKNIFYEYMQILPMIFIFILFMLNNTTAGLRHILPIYPFLFVFISKIAKMKKAWINFAIIVLILYYAASSLLIFPNYIAYFNEFIGGPANGYKHLVGSNIDFGQDLPGLKEFMDKNSIKKINLSYFGSIDPREYVNYDYMPSPYFQPWVPDYKQFITVTKRSEDCSERKGWVAISATNLQNTFIINQTCFNWLKKYEPVEKIGYSIFIYDLKGNKI